MAYPPLTLDSDLAGLPGAPFPTAVIRAAESSVRSEAGWHIAPVVRETVTVEASDPRYLPLPTLRPVTVYSVTDETGTAITGWTVRPGSVLLLPASSWWTCGTLYTIDLEHGYDSADDLLPVVAARCQRSMTDATLTQRSETVGQRTSSESYNVNRIDDTVGGTGSSSPLDRYRLHSFG